MTKLISEAELKKHTSEGDLWIAVSGDVYNVSTFAEAHPGGETLIHQYAGTDATEDFYSLHGKYVLAKYQKLKIGRLEGAKDTLALSGNSPVPFVEPPAMAGSHSPYYSPSHMACQKAVREFVMTEVAPIAHQVTC